MKNCSLVMILFLGLAFNGNSSSTGSSSVYRLFKDNLKRYIKEQKSSARVACKFSWFPGSSYILDFGSSSFGKGNSVDKNELELLFKISDADYERAIDAQDYEKVQELAQKIVAKIKDEKDVNKWHDQTYDIISRHNDPGVSRKKAIEQKLSRKDDPEVQEQFVFGIAVTMTVEEMMSSKK